MFAPNKLTKYCRAKKIVAAHEKQSKQADAVKKKEASKTKKSNVSNTATTDSLPHRQYCTEYQETGMFSDTHLYIYLARCDTDSGILTPPGEKDIGQKFPVFVSFNFLTNSGLFCSHY